MSRTAAAGHAFDSGALDRMAVGVGSTGLVLGRDGTGAPVLLPFFRTEPTSVVFVGGWWAARVLVLRCLALGATVAVRAVPTPDGVLAMPLQWTELDATAGGTGNRVWPMVGDRLVWRPADATQPVLHVYDVGPAGPVSRPALGPWQTQLTVLARVTPASVHALSVADLVLVQRLDRSEVDIAGVDTTSLDDDMVAVSDRVVWLTPTSVERHLFGEPTR